MTWAVLQFPGVNSTDDTAIVPSAVLLLESPTVTSDDGCEVRTMLKDAWPPASVVVRPPVGATEIPAVSSSRLVANTVGVRTLLYFVSVDVDWPVTV